MGAITVLNPLATGAALYTCFVDGGAATGGLGSTLVNRSCSTRGVSGEATEGVGGGENHRADHADVHDDGEQRTTAASRGCAIRFEQGAEHAGLLMVAVGPSVRPANSIGEAREAPMSDGLRDDYGRVSSCSGFDVDLLSNELSQQRITASQLSRVKKGRQMADSPCERHCRRATLDARLVPLKAMEVNVKRSVMVRILATACGVFALTAAGCATASDPISPPSTSTADAEFDQGSGITARALSAIQVQNLALLAKVWGFAKYHHPKLTAPGVNWDYELFRVLPAILAAPDRATASSAMVTWLDRQGTIPACDPCASAPSSTQIPTDNAWIQDVATVGTTLSDRLQSMHRNRRIVSAQAYVSFVPNVGNPDFSSEQRYIAMPSPDAGYRLLALFRFWNIITYWFPYRDIMNEDWNGVLLEYIPVMMRALDGDAYRLALIRLIARVHDTHANIWSDLRVQPPTGSSEAPLILRFVENNKLVVSGYTHATLGPATGLQIGDEIRSIGGVAVEALVDSLRPYYPASNEPTRLRDMALSLTRGTGPVELAGSRPSGAFMVSVNRVPITSLNRSRAFVHDLEGPAFRMLADSVAYLKISSAVAANAASYVEQAQRAKVFVIDIRNYPSEFVVFALGGHLVSGTSFARFTTGDATNPGAFRFGAFASHTSRTPRFTGSVVILVDEVTQSSAEYHAMGFRVAPGAIVVGSTTAGADGNVSRIPLPGNVEGMITGIGVFYPNGSPTQRIGILPDLVVRPTVAGIRAGRDEVLEAGVSRALGREFRLP